MDLRSIRYFVTVAARLSYSRAAETLHVSQSALSRQIQLLEHELRVPLFDRIGRGIALTLAGEELLERCRALLNDAAALKGRAEELASGSRGELCIGATPQTLESLVSQVLTQLRRRVPGITVSLVEDGSANLIAQVEAGVVHVAISALPHRTNLETRRLFPLRALAVVPRQHRLAKQRSIEITELAGERLLLLRGGFMTRQLFDGACQVANVAPQITIESANPHCLLTLAAGDHGIAVIPSTVKLGRLRERVIPLHQAGQPLGLWMAAIWDPRRHLPPTAASFIEAVYDFTRKDYPGRHFVNA